MFSKIMLFLLQELLRQRFVKQYRERCVLIGTAILAIQHRVYKQTFPTVVHSMSITYSINSTM